MTRIAPEGWRVIGVAAALLAAVAVAGITLDHAWVTVPALLAFAACCWFFRDPEREAPPDPRLVVSPADGRVVDVASIEEHDFLGARATRVSIFMSPLDVHVNRSPVAGVVEQVRHIPGRFRAAFANKASDENERHATLLAADGRRFLVVQIAGAVARRIVCRCRPGDVVARGERFGMIMFGSRVDVYLPPDVTVRAALHMRVRAGASVIGEVPT